jgi:hypothetical protein
MKNINIYLNVCWVANIICLLYFAIALILFPFYDHIIQLLFFSIIGKTIYYIAGFLGIILWIYCLVKNAQITNNSIHLILLIFLSSLYLPFYYYFFVLRKRSKVKIIEVTTNT